MVYLITAAVTAAVGLAIAEAILWPMRRRNDKLLADIAALQREIRDMERDIDLWDAIDGDLDLDLDDESETVFDSRFTVR